MHCLAGSLAPDHRLAGSQLCWIMTMSDDDEVENTPDLSISSEKVCYLILKAREFDAKDVVTDPDDASNPTDDGTVSVQEAHRDNPAVKEIPATMSAIP